MNASSDGTRTQFPLVSGLAARWLQTLAALSIAASALLVYATPAQAAKPRIAVSALGNTLRITFVAPRTSTLELRYFARAETVRQDGCSWKSTSGGKGGRVGEPVLINLSPSSRQGRTWCPGPLRLTVFMQRSLGGLVAKNATAQTFRLVGRVTYIME